MEFIDVDGGSNHGHHPLYQVQRGVLAHYNLSLKRLQTILIEFTG